MTAASTELRSKIIERLTLGVSESLGKLFFHFKIMNVYKLSVIGVLYGLTSNGVELSTAKAFLYLIYLLKPNGKEFVMSLLTKRVQLTYQLLIIGNR